MAAGAVRTSYVSDVPFGVLLRLMMIFAPGYIHPDEFFQTQEVASKWILGYDALVPWEFSCEHDGLLYRSVVPPLVSCGAPFALLSRSWLSGSSLWALILPRLFVFGLSLVADWCVRRLFGERTFYVYRSSWVSIVLLARPLSNSLAVLLLVFCAYAGFMRRPMVLGACAVAGTFIHVTFPAYVLPIAVVWVAQEVTATREAHAILGEKNRGLAEIAPAKAPGPSSDDSNASSATPVILKTLFKQAAWGLLGASLCLAVFVGADSAYVSSLDACVPDNSPLPSWLREPVPGVQLTLTPLNNLAYNLRLDNLAKHGLHPRYLHAVVNMQLLFSPLWIFSLFRKSVFHTRKRMTMAAVIVSGLATLSMAPHQEPRFLLPLLLPVAVLTTEPVTRNSSAQFFWVLFNIILGIFYGFVHQAGVVPALLAIEGELFETQESVRCIATYETYMMPRFLFTDHNVTDIDLMGADPEQIYDTLCAAGCPNDDWYLIFPSSARADFPRFLERPPVATFFPHFSGERPPSSLQDLRLELLRVRLDELAPGSVEQGTKEESLAHEDLAFSESEHCQAESGATN